VFFLFFVFLARRCVGEGEREGEGEGEGEEEEEERRLRLRRAGEGVGVGAGMEMVDDGWWIVDGGWGNDREVGSLAFAG
jgi:hypothetical protein